MSHVDYTEKSPVGISICTGMRGLERGLGRAFQVLGWDQPTYTAYVEIEAFVAYNLVRQMEQGLVDPGPVWTNLKTFPSRQFYRKVDFIVGGYPCQGESVAGKQEYEKYTGYLWPYVARMVESIRPLWCFFENVENHLNGTFPNVYRDLRKMGYKVEAGIYSAEEVGAPHGRRRLFILAVLDNANRSEQRNSGKDRANKKRESRAKHGTIVSGRTSETKCSELENPSKLGCGRGTNKREGKTGPERTGNAPEVERSGKQLADSISNRLQGTRNKSNGSGSIGLCSSQGENETWPAPPGQYQYEWEEPRQIESSMGITIDGYDFTTDLLRMAGNGVVEQTAEKAFLDLLNRFHVEH